MVLNCCEKSRSIGVVGMCVCLYQDLAFCAFFLLVWCLFMLQWALFFWEGSPVDFGTWFKGICVHSETSAVLFSGTDIGAFPFITKPFRSKHLCSSNPKNSWQTMSSWSSVCVQDYCLVGRGLGLWIPESAKEILDNGVFKNLAPVWGKNRIWEWWSGVHLLYIKFLAIMWDASWIVGLAYDAFPHTYAHLGQFSVVNPLTCMFLECICL